MKKVIIGGSISLCGAIIHAAVIIAAGVYSVSLTSWSGSSKFWYAIFGAPTYGNEVNLSLKAGFLFVASLILVLAGIIIMALELFGNKN
jgi:predicted Co/Zn/Cd cation transporter (cation efflux family)